MTNSALIWDRGEALRFIRGQLAELQQVAAAHGLPLLSYLLDMVYLESDDIIKREDHGGPGDVAGAG